MPTDRTNLGDAAGSTYAPQAPPPKPFKVTPPMLPPMHPQRLATIRGLVKHSFTATPHQIPVIANRLKALQLSPDEVAYVARYSAAAGPKAEKARQQADWHDLVHTVLPALANVPLAAVGSNTRLVKYAAEHPLARAEQKGPFKQAAGRPQADISLPWLSGKIADLVKLGRVGKVVGEAAPIVKAPAAEAAAKVAPAAARPTVEMTEAQATKRLAQLDRMHAKALEQLGPAVNPYSPELAKSETLSRNTLRGRLAAGKQPATGKAIEGRVGGGSKSIPTVGQDVNALAETKLHELIARYPDHPVSVKAAAVIAERDQLRAALNARGEASIAGVEPPPLPHIPAPVKAAGSPPLPTERPGTLPSWTPQGQVFPRPSSPGRFPGKAAEPSTLFTGETSGIPGTPMSPQGEAFPSRVPPPRPITASPGPGEVPKVPRGMETPATGGQLGRQVREGLRGAGAARKAQDVVYSEERGQRAGEYARRLAANPTMAGAMAAKGALAGELPKLHFGGFQQFDQPALDALVRHVAEHPMLRPFEKAGTIDALAQISGGKVPTRGQIKLLRQVFGRETSGDLVRSVSTWQKWRDRGVNALNVPRSIMASFDVSAPFRQGLVIGVTHPVIFSKNLVPMFKALGSERFYQATLEEIHGRPTYPAMQQAGVSFTELGQSLTHREEQFQSNLAEQIPGLGRIIRGSGRAYTGFLDKTRADVFDFLLEKATQSGLDPQDQRLLEGIGGFVNSATGRGSLGALQEHATTLNALMFSPRLLASRLNFMNPVWYVHLDPFARKEAFKAAASLVATMGLVMYVAKLAGARVSSDPRNADFAKIRIGDTRIDLAGGFQQPVRLIAQMVTGQSVSSTTGALQAIGPAGIGKTSRADLFLRFLRSKSAPIPGAAWDLSSQNTFAGQPLTWQNEVLPRVTPLAGQDAFDLYQNRKSVPAGLGAYGLSAIGIGVQTYKAKQKKKAGVSGSSYAPRSGGSRSRYAPSGSSFP